MRDGTGQFFRTEGSAQIALPQRVEEAMADIAFVFHWPLSSMDAMELSELVGWQQLAVKRFNAVNSPPDRKA